MSSIQREGRLLVDDISRNGGCAAFFRADLSRPDEARRIVPFTIETFGQLDYAFNNAGISGSYRRRLTGRIDGCPDN
jgi:NAD(P)-dependent dehydrogenase (short-subunit alcohol dehydrogenase family)